MHIAIVEDEIKLGNTLKEGFESEGYDISLFRDGESAEQRLLQNSSEYSLVILDLMLPRKSGSEVCQTLRRQGIPTPVLILTARDSVEDKVAALDSGADDFLTKPFSFEELMARVRALTRRAQGRISEKILLKDLEIQMGARQVTRAGKNLQLTSTEFDLLALLIKNPERVLTREEISLQLWDSKDASFSNVVDVHISNLRKKINDEHEQKIVRTVRGMGYAIQK